MEVTITTEQWAEIHDHFEATTAFIGEATAFMHLVLGFLTVALVSFYIWKLIDWFRDNIY